MSLIIANYAEKVSKSNINFTKMFLIKNRPELSEFYFTTGSQDQFSPQNIQSEGSRGKIKCKITQKSNCTQLVS